MLAGSCSAGSESIAKLGYPIDYDDQDLSDLDLEKYLHSQKDNA